LDQYKARFVLQPFARTVGTATIHDDNFSVCEASFDGCQRCWQFCKFVQDGDYDGKLHTRQ
jgi:hypothetical protein